MTSEDKKQAKERVILSLCEIYDIRPSEARRSLKELEDKICAAEKRCICPPKKNDGSAFDGVSYYCPLHGR